MTTIDQTNKTNWNSVPQDDDGGARATSGAPSLLASGLNELAVSGDPGAALAALVVAMGRSERQSSEKLKAVAERLQEGEEQKQLDEMQNKAVAALASGVVSGAATAASGACSAASGLKSAQADLAGDKLNNLGKAADSGVAANLAQQKYDFKVDATNLKLGGDSISASGKLTASLLDYAALGDDTSATAHSHAASHARNAVDDARASQQDAQKLLDKALEFYKEYSSTKEQTTATAARRA